MITQLTSAELDEIRRALRFYARRANHWTQYSRQDRLTPVQRDSGARAQAALALLEPVLYEIDRAAYAEERDT